jgi:hypothetical protein
LSRKIKEIFGEIPPVIIIGVANINRYGDLLPVKTRYCSEGGGADMFHSVLVSSPWMVYDRDQKYI